LKRVKGKCLKLKVFQRKLKIGIKNIEFLDTGYKIPDTKEKK
jgi:hypothetical protein